MLSREVVKLLRFKVEYGVVAEIDCEIDAAE